MPITFQSLIAADASREQIEEWCRSRTQHYGCGDLVVARVLGKYLVYCLERDSALTPHLVLDGIWEPWVTMAIARHVKRGMRCMDVGACYGYYALLMADLAGPDLVQAWEPVWTHLVKVSAQLNGLSVDLVGSVMASVEGTKLYRQWPRRTMFNAGDIKMLPTEARWNSPVLTARPAPVTYDFVKIDVEGAEADVWEALSGVRSVSPKLTVCMEFTPEKHGDPEAFLRQLEADGFELGTVGHDGWPRPCAIDEATAADTGGFRMLWLTRSNR